MRTRLALGLAGVALMAFGLRRLLQTGLDNVVDTAVWLGGGVILHDGIVAPLTIVVTVVLLGLVPPAHRARFTIAAVLIATVTVTAVPVLGGWGAREDNPTLLPRNYVAGWLLMVALVLGVTVAEGVWHGRRSRRR